MTSYDPAQLRTFLAVAQTRSFTQAAARLGIRQPTVSQHVRKLETAVGRVLVLRDTHTVALTSDGEAMIGFARSILAAHDDAAAYFRGERPHGRLRIGMSDDLALTRLPQILRDFRRDHPGVDLDLTVDQSGTLHRRLENSPKANATEPLTANLGATDGCQGFWIRARVPGDGTYTLTNSRTGFSKTYKVRR